MQLIFRILLSPFIFVYGLILLITMCVFPLPLIVIFSLMGMIEYPVFFVLNKIGLNEKYLEPVISYLGIRDNGSVFINHFIGFTIFIWGAFAVTWVFIKKGELFKL